MHWIQKSTCAVALAVCASFPAFAQPHGFEGSWGLVGTQCATVGDTVPTEITSAEIHFYESRCAIADVTPIGDAGSTWQIAAECRGEGEEWTVPYLLAVLDVEGRQSMVMINMAHGRAWLTERCN